MIVANPDRDRPSASPMRPRGRTRVVPWRWAMWAWNVALVAAAAGCTDVTGVVEPVVQPQAPSAVYGEGGPCETWSLEAYKSCYVIWGSRKTIQPGPDCTPSICWTTFPLGTELSKFLTAKKLLLDSSHQECKEAGGRLGTLIDEGRVSYWVPEDKDANGDSVFGTTWTSGLNYGTVAMQFWKGMLTGYSAARVNWEIAHELGHDRLGDDELQAWAFATLCFGLKPAK